MSQLLNRLNAFFYGNTYINNNKFNYLILYYKSYFQNTTENFIFDKINMSDLVNDNLNISLNAFLKKYDLKISDKSFKINIITFNN